MSQKTFPAVNFAGSTSKRFESAGAANSQDGPKIGYRLG